jgi:hypothetical protein
VLLSNEIDTPQVCGLFEPVVLVPARAMAALTVEERTMTPCHELMHIRRRDLVLGWVPACAERLFFFHPLVRLAAREYVDARESACDAAAVRALGVSAGDYGHMLVRLGIGRAGSVFAAGGSPFSASSLKRRLRMLERQDAPVSRRWWLALVLIAAVVIPMQLVARTPERPAQETTSPAALQSITADIVPFQMSGDVSTETGQVDLRMTLPLAELEKVAAQLQKADAALKAQGQQAQTRTAQQEMIEALALVEAARARSAEARQALQTEDQKRMLELIALIKAAASHRAVARDPQTLADVVRRQQADLAQHHRQLAEHYERLAVEQRRLAEEIERLQRQSAPAK